MNKRVFLLGAGFSKAGGLPLARNFVKFLEKHLRKSPDMGDIKCNKEFLDFMKKIRKRFPFMEKDLELLLTYIDLALIRNSTGIFKSFGFKIRRNRDKDMDKIIKGESLTDDLNLFRNKISGAIVRSFESANAQFLSDNKKTTRKKKKNDQRYYKFGQSLNPNDVIITFNYDIIAEKTLWIQDKWTFLDGYGFDKNKKDFEDANTSRFYPKNKPEQSVIKVYKLHGSVGWIYSDIEEKIYLEGMQNYFPPYYGNYSERGMPFLGTHSENSTLIEPTYLKNFNNPVLLNIWNKAFLEIQQANELIVIGYSLPEADSATRIFLSNAVKNSQISKITVVSPPVSQKEMLGQISVFEKFENLFNRDVVKKKMKFEEYIDQL